MSTPSPVLVAAAPSIKATLQALSTFITNLGPDDEKLPETFPGALQVLLGSVELQLPVVVNAEWGMVQSDAQTKITGLIQRLDTAVAPISHAPLASYPLPGAGNLAG